MFGPELERAVGSFLVALMVASAIAGAVVWNVGAWVLRHLTVGWQ